MQMVKKFKNSISFADWFDVMRVLYWYVLFKIQKFKLSRFKLPFDIFYSTDIDIELIVSMKISKMVPWYLNH